MDCMHTILNYNKKCLTSNQFKYLFETNIMLKIKIIFLDLIHSKPDLIQWIILFNDYKLKKTVQNK